jgi:hypothetical protein
VVTIEELQESVENMLEAIYEENCDSNNLIAINTENTANFGLNVALMDEFYVKMRILRDLVVSDTASEGDLKAALQQYLKVSTSFINSQKGLENFLTDEAKKKDPALVNIYSYYNRFVAAGERLITDRGYATEYFSQKTAEFFVVFTLEILKVIERN